MRASERTSEGDKTFPAHQLSQSEALKREYRLANRGTPFSFSPIELHAIHVFIRFSIKNKSLLSIEIERKYLKAFLSLSPSDFLTNPKTSAANEMPLPLLLSTADQRNAERVTSYLASVGPEQMCAKVLCANFPLDLSSDTKVI